MSFKLKIGEKDIFPIEGTLERNGWRITPLNKMEARRVVIIRFISIPFPVTPTQVSIRDVALSSSLSPRLMKLEWIGKGKLKPLVQKLMQEGPNCLIVCQPAATSIGMRGILLCMMCGDQ